MNILLTGGAGFIGSHTAWAVAQAGHRPVVFDNLSMGHRHNVKWGPLIEGELADADLVRKTLTGHSIDAVIHFAGLIAVGESVVNPRRYFDHNCVASLALLNAMLDAGVKTIVFSSTAAVYGDPVRVPIPEDHPLVPVNPYGETKLFIERVLRFYGDAYGLKWTALRYFNAAGAAIEAGLCEQHHPETHLIPLVIQAALGIRPSIDIFGTDYPTPDGTAIRDYIHVAGSGARRICRRWNVWVPANRARGVQSRHGNGLVRAAGNRRGPEIQRARNSRSRIPPPCRRSSGAGSGFAAGSKNARRGRRDFRICRPS